MSMKTYQCKHCGDSILRGFPNSPPPRLVRFCTKARFMTDWILVKNRTPQLECVTYRCTNCNLVTVDHAHLADRIILECVNCHGPHVFVKETGARQSNQLIGRVQQNEYKSPISLQTALEIVFQRIACPDDNPAELAERTVRALKSAEKYNRQIMFGFVYDTSGDSVFIECQIPSKSLPIAENSQTDRQDADLMPCGHSAAMSIGDCMTPACAMCKSEQNAKLVLVIQELRRDKACWSVAVISAIRVRQAVIHANESKHDSVSIDKCSHPSCVETMKILATL